MTARPAQTIGSVSPTFADSLTGATIQFWHDGLVLEFNGTIVEMTFSPEQRAEVLRFLEGWWQ